MTVELVERVNQNSTNSSRPPSSDSPFSGPLPGLGGPLPGKPGASKPTAGLGPSSGPAPSDPKRKPGKQPGAKGVWRSEALTPERTEDHYPSHCERCGAALELWFTHEGASAHLVLDLERQAAGVRVACVKHCYFAVACACGAKTAARALTGAVSILEGRKDQLRPSQASLVGPGLTTFIAALSVRYRMSRAKIAEFLSSWLDVRLSIVHWRHRSVHPRSGPGLRADRGRAHRCAPRRGRDPRRRDPLAPTGPQASLALGGAELDDGDLSHLQPSCRDDP
jgi:hypothetical protein